MGPNAWQSEIFKVFTYLSFSRKRPFCNWTKFRRRNARNRIGEFPIILFFYVVGIDAELNWLTFSGQQNILDFKAVFSLFWLAVVRLLSLSTVERQFICACRKWRDEGTYVGEQQWIEYLKQPFLRQPFLSFVPL